MRDLLLIISSGICVLSLVAGLFFWRFWRRTLDRLFIFFALAFWGFALERILILTSVLLKEDHPATYLVRLLSFAMIAVGIIEKNREPDK